MRNKHDPRAGESARPAAADDKLAQRRARQAEALRRNLERRKAQSRGRKTPPESEREA